MIIRICKNCDHQEENHPNHFLCDIEECHCPGWIKLVEGLNDRS